MKPCIPPPALALAAGACMSALHRWFPLARCVSPPWQWLGLLPAALGVAISVMAFGRFRRVRTTVNPLDPSKATHLVTDGVFSVSRNPMYLGLMLVLVGWAIWQGTVSSWLVLPLFWAIITYGQIVPEEQALSRLFGEQYAAYRREVGRWIGRRTPNASTR
jgi:protein-S-isoprenylcysteine O-methyltransferase Ste14